MHCTDLRPTLSGALVLAFGIALTACGDSCPDCEPTTGVADESGEGTGESETSGADSESSGETDTTTSGDGDGTTGDGDGTSGDGTTGDGDGTSGDGDGTSGDGDGTSGDGDGTTGDGDGTTGDGDGDGTADCFLLKEAECQASPNCSAMMGTPLMADPGTGNLCSGDPQFAFCMPPSPCLPALETVCNGNQAWEVWSICPKPPGWSSCDPGPVVGPCPP